MPVSIQSDLIGGLDEVGQGALAGPLVIVVAAFSSALQRPAGVRDSKACTRKQISDLAIPLVEMASFVGVGYASARTINKVGIRPAWDIAASRALVGCPALTMLITDGLHGVVGYKGKQQYMPKADAIHWQVSAASIIAKYLRDIEMLEFRSAYPQFSFDKHVGYGTAVHIEELRTNGATPIHRTQFLRSII